VVLRLREEKWIVAMEWGKLGRGGGRRGHDPLMLFGEMVQCFFSLCFSEAKVKKRKQIPS
jgi:hypothetical protein